MVAIWRKNMQSRPCDHFMRHLRVTKSCWSVFRSHKSLFPLKNCYLVMWCTFKWQRALRVSGGARRRQLRYKCVRMLIQSGAGYINSILESRKVPVSLNKWHAFSPFQKVISIVVRGKWKVNTFRHYVYWLASFLHQFEQSFQNPVLIPLTNLTPKMQCRRPQCCQLIQPSGCIDRTGGLRIRVH